MMDGKDIDVSTRKEQAMTIEERAIEYLQPIADSATVGHYGEMLGVALTALREKVEREKPKPLTLEELRKWDGKPVWVVTLEDGERNPPYWAIADTANGNRSRGIRLVSKEDSDDSGAYELYGETWIAYDYQPKDTANA